MVILYVSGKTRCMWGITVKCLECSREFKARSSFGIYGMSLMTHDILFSMPSKESLFSQILWLSAHCVIECFCSFERILNVLVSIPMMDGQLSHFQNSPNETLLLAQNINIWPAAVVRLYAVCLALWTSPAHPSDHKSSRLHSWENWKPASIWPAIDQLICVTV